MIDFSRYKALTFDCYGTLIDWETGIATLARGSLDDEARTVPIDLVLSAFALHQAKHQQVRPALPYPEILKLTWRDVQATFGWPEDPGHQQRFAASVGEWPPFPDTIESLAYLSRFHKLVILSNVDNASLLESIERMGAPIDLTVTAEDVGSYKPGLAHFETAFSKLDTMGVAKGQILHVAQSKHHDIEPGRRLGLTTVWVDRRRDQRGTGATLATHAEPDLRVTSLAELVRAHERHRLTTGAHRSYAKKAPAPPPRSGR